MGYESRLYVVRKSYLYRSEDKKQWGEVIATFNLSKVPFFGEMQMYSATDVFIYGGDGNTEINTDMYGKPLAEIPLDDMIWLLERAEKTGQIFQHRRYAPCIAMLKAFRDNGWNDLVVLHYGY